MPELSHKELLSNVDAFSGLDDAHHELLAERFNRKKFSVGEQVFAEGERIDIFSIVISGSVDIVLPEQGAQVHRPSELKLASVGPGEHFGEYSLLDLRPASASAIAAEDTVLLQISSRDLHSLLEKHSEIGKTVYFNLALSLVDRLRSKNSELDLVFFD